MDPRRTKIWQRMNEVDYSQKLSVIERQWLHAFNCDYYTQKPRHDALDQNPSEITAEISSDGVATYSAPENNLSGIRLSDLKIYLRVKKEGISQHAASKESGTPRTTLRRRLEVVEELLQQINWATLLANVEGEEDCGNF